MTQPPYPAGRGRLLARVLTLTTLVAAAAAIGFGGCTLSRDGTLEQQCTSTADCPAPSSDCVVAVCTEEGACVEEVHLDPEGNLVEPDQVLHDCKTRACESDGTLVETPEDSDKPDDVICVTAYSCQDGELTTTDVGVGDSCQDGGSSGTCALDDNNQVYCRFPCGPTDECEPSTNPCLEYVCNTVTHYCDPSYLDNVPSPGDTEGDCGVAFCVAGAEQVTIDNSDLPPDEICSTGICTDGEPGQSPRPPGFFCNGGGDLEVCDGAGACVECVDIGSCEQLDPPTDCSYRECVANQCVYTHRPNGYVIASQNAGDCKDVVCDGNGNTTQVNNDGDTPDDLNPCTSNVCTNGIPSNPGCCAGVTCGNPGVCGNAGQLGSCVGCNDPIDCGADNPPCMARTCVNHVCGQSFAPSGTLVTNNPVGDCKRQVCDGAGNTIFQNSNDPPTAPSDCQYYVCSSGNPVLTNQGNGSPCPNDSDGLFCTGPESCQGGSCVSAGNPCVPHGYGSTDCTEVCREAQDDCGGNDPNGSACGSSADTTCDDPDSCLNGVCQVNNVGNGTSCNDGTYCNGSDTCQSGVCSPSNVNPCSGHNVGPLCNDSCNEGAGNCTGNDILNTPCTGGSCNGGGVCKKDPGETCGGANECASGYCVDTVCCSTSCTGNCRTCNGGTPGTCEEYAAGTDPENWCTVPSSAGPSCSAGACACGVDPAVADDTHNSPTVDVACAAGSDCVVNCTASNSCQNITVTCPSQNGCVVNCSGSNSCDDITVACGSDGTCSISCDNNTCGGNAQLNCGQDSCTSTCTGTHSLAVSQGNSCSYTNSGC